MYTLFLETSSQPNYVSGAIRRYLFNTEGYHSLHSWRDTLVFKYIWDKMVAWISKINPKAYRWGVMEQKHWIVSEVFCCPKTGALKILGLLMTPKMHNISAKVW